MKRVLMIAHAFPPFRSVGHSIRVVKFIKHLPSFGWLPTVLTINDDKEYETIRRQGSESLLSEIPPEVHVYRTRAAEPSLEFLEKEQMFAQRNRLAGAIVKVSSGVRRWSLRNLFLPNRYIAWLPFAVRRGRQIAFGEAVDAIFATSPPHVDCLVGAYLKRLTGKPLVLDFRDEWIGTPGYAVKSTVARLIERKMEAWAVRTADKVILVTEWSKSAFLERYPDESNEKFVFISNGCDLEDFAKLNLMTATPRNSRFTILHAGSISESGPWARNPAALFKAIHRLLRQHPDLADKLTLVFAGDFPEGHRSLAEDMKLSGVIKELGHLPHDEVLRVMRSADLLVAFSYEGFSTMIPGKIYEYWAVGGPPILLLNRDGAAREFIEERRLGFAVERDDASRIEEAILTVYRRYAMNTPIQISTEGIEDYDRKVLSKSLAQVLSSVAPMG